MVEKETMDTPFDENDINENFDKSNKNAMIIQKVNKPFMLSFDNAEILKKFGLELEQENAELDLSSFNFITKINSELNNIIYKPKNFDQFETINSALKKIDISSYYDVKFIFGQNNYDLKQSIDIEEGVTSLCTLKSFEKSFS